MASTNTKTFGGLEVKKATEAEAWGVFLAIYGPGGIGKTTLAASAADSKYGAPVCIVDVEGGAWVVSDRADIEIVEPNTWSEIEKFSKDLYNTPTENIPWKTVVYDNLSEMRDKCHNEVPDSVKDDRQVYRISTNKILDFARRCRETARKKGINIIIILWDADEKDGENGPLIKNMALNPALRISLPGIFNIVGYLTLSQDGQRVLDLGVSLKTKAKFRRNRSEVAQTIPERIYNPNMVSILDTLKGGQPFNVKAHEKPKVNT